MEIRKRVLLDGEYKCVDCGHVSASNQIDHVLPLDHGGTDAIENLVVRCIPCHELKTTAQNKRT